MSITREVYGEKEFMDGYWVAHECQESWKN